MQDQCWRWKCSKLILKKSQQHQWYRFDVFIYFTYLKSMFHSYRKHLTVSWRRPLSYRNQSIDLQSKSMDWFLYDNALRHERVTWFASQMKWLVSMWREHWYLMGEPFNTWCPLKGFICLNKHTAFSCRFYEVYMTFSWTPDFKRLIDSAHGSFTFIVEFDQKM